MPNKLNELTQRMTVSAALPREWVLWFQELVTLIGNKLDTVLSASGKLPVFNASGELEASTLDAEAVVSGSGTSVVGHLAVFDNTSATVIKDGGELLSLDAAETVVIETGYGQAAILGDDDGTYARGGHSHGTPGLPALDDLSDVALTSSEQGDILIRTATGWVNLGHGTDGQVLTTKGHGANPDWAAASGGLEKLAVADIDSPTELSGLSGMSSGDTVLAYDSAGEFTVYCYNSGVADNSPYALGGWVAVAGRYSNLSLQTDQMLVNDQPTNDCHVVRKVDMVTYWPFGYWPTGYWP